MDTTCSLDVRYNAWLNLASFVTYIMPELNLASFNTLVQPCRDALHREFKDATVLKLLVAMDKDTR